MTTRNEPKNFVREGLEAMQLEDAQRAEALFLQALSIDPECPDANHLLGILYLQFHNSPDTAEYYISRAQANRPQEPVFLNSLGTVYWHQGELDKAKEVFEKTVELKPDYVDAIYNLGNAQRDLKAYSRAIYNYRKVIELDPEYINAYNDLGITLLCEGKIHAAVEQYNLALEQDPMRADIYLNLANAYMELGETEGAFLSIQNALAIDPNNARAYNNLGSVYYGQENYPEAITAYRHAAQLDTGSLEVFFNLGLALFKNKEYDESLRVHDQAFQIKREWPPLLVNRANTLYKLERFEEAISGYQAALKILPDYKPAFISMAATYRRMGELKQAVYWFDRVICSEPDNPSAHFGKSLALLKSGEFAAGWRHYEWRFEVTDKHFIKLPNLNCIEWHGEQISGASLTVIGEQGYGDIIHFARYIPELKKRCRSITFCCAPSLTRLFKDLPGIDHFVDREQTWTLKTDYHVYLLSLPNIFNTILETIPSQVPYVSADPVAVESWKARLNSETMNIGIVWGGNPDQIENIDRSCPVEVLLPLTEIPGTTFYCLQMGESRDQLLDLSLSEHRIVDYTEELEDFADTAALVKALDLVITIDTSVAHLAGALNHPVWTILWFAHCWRYLQKREDSPWYPSMRLFRQPSIGDWQSVIQQVSDALRIKVKERSEKR
ncbi:MAG: tetratricopeptide repeat protein [Gammaproteobacteria bacterium]|nr:MAG: tetratricopeptide repeat protein [Gammaproteobacteria bacterium]